MVIERYSTQKDLVEVTTNAILLDCGCRVGDNTLNLATQIDTKHLIDLVYNLRSLYKAYHRGILTIQSDLNHSIPILGHLIDVIIAKDVLEHLINPSVFVKEMYRVLNPGGYIILDIPNLASWHNNFALLIGVQPFSGPYFTTMEDSDVGLVRQMNRTTHGLQEEGEFLEHGEQELTHDIKIIAYSSLISLLKRKGFKIEKA